jgi:hypothetical protein
VALPIRPLVPVVGLLLTVGLLVLVRPVLAATRPDEVLFVVGRLDILPLLLMLLLLIRPDMLPPPLLFWRPSFVRLWLIEPLLPLLPCLTLAT